MKRILVVEDDLAFSNILQRFLDKKGFKVTASGTLAEAWKEINTTKPDAILADVRLPDGNGLDLLEKIQEHESQIPLILMTGYADVSHAVTAIKKGAIDYISKPLVPEEVIVVLNTALNTSTEPVKNTSNKGIPTSNKVESSALFGNSNTAQQLKQHIELVGPTPLSVLITGESGTGKEVIAQTLHAHSDRANQPFIALDCGAIPKELASSEFFGHLKGAFTGAVSDKIGCFEAANGGTLFLDEIGNLSYENQMQLLRALQERKIKRIGSNTEIPVDIRVITATNEDLKEAVRNGQFREDLYHRLNEFSLQLAPLRERTEDLLVFATHFLELANQQLNKAIIGFTPEVLHAFMHYEWPGNLRELQNVIKRATLLSPGKMIEKSAIPVELYMPTKENSRMGSVTTTASNGIKSKAQNEKERIVSALQATAGNKSEAARLLEMTRKTLYNKLKLYDLEDL